MPRVPPVAIPATLFVLFVLGQLLALPASSFSNDSYRYDLLAHEYAGASAPAATRAANADFCAEAVRQDLRGRLLLPAAASFPAPVPGDAAACRARLGATMPAPNDPRYTRIFSTRPGYPLLAAPFVAALGGPTGLRLASVLVTGLAGVLVFATLRVLLPAARRLVAVLGQALCYLCPTGAYGVRPLSEGAALLCLTAGLLGVALCCAGSGARRRPLGRRRLWVGGALLAAAYLALGLVRYAEALPVALVTALGAGLCLLRARSRTGGAAVVCAVSAVAVTGLGVGDAVWHLPSIGLSLQDLFSAHFTQPLAPDPGARLVVLNRRFWWQWLQDEAQTPVLPVALVLAVLGLRRVPGPVAAFLAGCAVTGAAAVVAHPLAYEADRLLLPVWLPVILGLPLWLGTVNIARRVNEHPSSHLLASTRL